MGCLTVLKAKVLGNTRVTALMFLAGLLFPAVGIDAAPLQPGQMAPTFELPNLAEDAGNTSLISLRGKVVYVDFWASWCWPCRIAFPILDRIHKELRQQGFAVVSINLDEFEKDALAFLEEFPVSYLVVRDQQGDTPVRYGVQGMPTGFFIDRRGVIRKIHQGFRRGDARGLRRSAIKLLREPAPSTQP